MNIPFNKIFVIHCSDNHVRYDFIKNWVKEYDLEIAHMILNLRNDVELSKVLIKYLKIF